MACLEQSIALASKPLDSSLKHKEDIILNNMVAVLATGGGMGGVGIYNSQANSSGTPLGATYGPTLPFPVAEFFVKGLSWRTGGVNLRDVAGELVQLIASGVARPSFLVSAQIGIEEVREYYGRFDRHEETKVLIRFS
jgi:threonine dehydrogenase-like Zn-dependent dehydrogenase